MKKSINKREGSLKELLKETRLSLGENQEQFAKRFGVSTNTISRWESGIYEIPNKVLEIILRNKQIEVICPHCMGKGLIKRLDTNL